MSRALAVAADPAPSRGYMPRSKANDWRTPPEVIALVRTLWHGRIDLDPCASSDPAHHFAAHNLTVEDDGLEEAWEGCAYVNPPFDALDAWAARCAEQGAVRGNEVVLLLPARTDTRYWHEYVTRARAVCFLRGRLRFVGATASCPFPTALAYWGAAPWRFHAVFSPRGWVVAP